MNLKWKKKYLGPILGLVGAAVLIGGVYLYSSSNIQPDHQKEMCIRDSSLIPQLNYPQLEL